MAIQLKCPNGHPLTAPDSKVGQSGKCPECGVRFRVPSPEDSRTAVESPSGDSGSTLMRADMKIDLEKPIAFLCPNGHRLNGPAKLAGRPGQCPHCNEKFVIPSLEELGQYQHDEAESEEELEEIEEIGPQDVTETTSAASEEKPEIKEETTIRRNGQSDVRLAEESALMPSPNGRNGSNGHSSLATTFDQLWKLRGTGEAVEITLKSGQTLVPDQVAGGNNEAALIATRQEDGKLCVTAVVWDAVATMQLRNVEKLPSELFGN